MIALQISPKIESLFELGRNYKGLYGILQPFLDKFPLKILKLGWVAFHDHSLTFQLKCLDF